MGRGETEALVDADCVASVPTTHACVEGLGMLERFVPQLCA